MAIMSSSDDEGELDRILGGAESDELEAMNSSSQQPDGSQEPAPIDDAVSTVGLAPRKGRTGGEMRGGGPWQRRSLSFSDACATAMECTVDREILAF